MSYATTYYVICRRTSRVIPSQRPSVSYCGCNLPWICPSSYGGLKSVICDVSQSLCLSGCDTYICRVSPMSSDFRCNGCRHFCIGCRNSCCRFCNGSRSCCCRGTCTYGWMNTCCNSRGTCKRSSTGSIRGCHGIHLGGRRRRNVLCCNGTSGCYGSSRGHCRHRRGYIRGEVRSGCCRGNIRCCSCRCSRNIRGLHRRTGGTGRQSPRVCIANSFSS